MKRLNRLMTASRARGAIACCALLTLCVAAVLSGCGDDTADLPELKIDATPYLLKQAPAGALEVKAVHDSAGQAGEVVIVGKIGGSLNPWIEGRAAFNIVDRSVKSCSDIPDDKCPTPWDYCCTRDDLPGATALVKVVGEDGRLLAADTRRLFGVKELQTVFVRGTASKDEKGNLVVLASSLYVKR